MLTTCRSQVGTNHNEVDVLDLPCRLELDHNPIGDQEIQAMETDLKPPSNPLKPPVENRNGHLTTK